MIPLLLTSSNFEILVFNFVSKKDFGLSIFFVVSFFSISLCFSVFTDSSSPLIFASFSALDFVFVVDVFLVVVVFDFGVVFLVVVFFFGVLFSAFASSAFASFGSFFSSLAAF